MRTFAEKQKTTHQTKPASSTTLGWVLSSRNHAVGSILDLPRTIGNEAAQCSIHANAENREPDAPVAADYPFGHDFSQIPVLPQAPTRTSKPAVVAHYRRAGAEDSLPEVRTTVERYPLRATIRRAPTALLRLSRHDALPGQEPGDEQYFSVFERLGSLPASGSTTAFQGTDTQRTKGEVAGAPVEVPDIEIPALGAFGRSDAVNAGFTYSGSITRGGAAPNGFGVTRSFDSKLSGVTITPTPGTFNVAATFEHPITYQVRSGTGPNGQVDIASDSDPDITSANYRTVASDLTPDMSDLNGRPPRTSFWAEDLTLRHELVHANDDRANGPGAMAIVTTWLNAQTAANVAQVGTLLAALPGRFATALLAALSTVAGERHAYGDGAPHYRARANAIKAKGDRGEYPSTLGAVLGGIGGLAVGGAAGAGIGFGIGGPVGALVGGIIGGIGGLIGGIFAGRSI